MCSGDMRLCHENHRPGDLLCCQVISKCLIQYKQSKFNSFTARQPFRAHITNVSCACCHSGSLEQSLKDGLQKFSNARRYEYWSQYVKSLVCHVAEMEEEGICYFTETQMLISAWRMLLILSTSHVCYVQHNSICRFYMWCEQEDNILPEFLWVNKSQRETHSGMYLQTKCL